MLALLTIPWGSFPTLLLQTSLETRTADVIQYLIGTGVLALIGLVWRLQNGQTAMGTRLTTIETILTRPATGLEARVGGISKKVHEHTSDIQGLVLRSEHAESNIERLDRDKADRTLQPTDVGKLAR